ncbi:hypothetical protein C1645_820989 [Glomus cerebriforme]|uniref:Cell end marker tea3 n=1 Tax=Glomus cerebriforme TaxID=658196 RepID=A0A397T211_9GLOM|nr:hypothetical protein C1645_820989 [Glomus cerebriforme]
MFSKKQKQQKHGPWVQKKLSITNPFPRYGHSINQSGINDQIYIFGGIAGGNVTNDVLMVETNTLNVCGLMTTGDIPPPRSFHTQVNIENKMIVFGGLPLNPIEKPDNNIYVLNTDTKQWYKPPIQGNPDVGRFGHSASVIGSKMYIFGGQSNGYYLNDLVAFDLQSLNYGVAQWEFISPLNDPPTGRSGQTICAYNDKLYVFGGTDGEKYYNDTWYYDIQTNTWGELSCIGYIPSPRKNHGAAIIDDIIYIFGGKGQDGLEMGDLVAFRISNQRWYMFSDMGIAPSPRQCLAMTSSRDKALVFGGDCLQSPKPGEDGTINVLDTAKIKYPVTSNQKTTSQQASPKFQQSFSQQTRAIPPPSSPNQFSNIRTTNMIDNNNNIITSRQNSMYPNGQLPPNEYNAAYYNMPYDNIKNQPPNNARQISPSGSQSSLNSPSPSPKIKPDNNNNMNILSPRMGSQGGSPRNQFFPKRPPNGSPSSLSNSPYSNNFDEVSESSRPLSPPVGQKQSFESLDKQSPSTPEGSRPFQSQVTGSNYEKLTNLPMHIASTIGDFQNPRQAPRPPNSFNTSSNKHANSQSNYTIYGGGGTISSPTSTSQNSLRSPTFDALDHFPAPISNTERDNFLRELQNRDVQINHFKSRETWLKAELALARQAGYVFEEDNNKLPDGIDTENLMNIGESGSDRNKIMLAIVKIKQELRRAKATIANQAQVASQKIIDAERARTAAIQEAVYFKAKLNALLDASESELARIEIERAADLEKRLSQALIEKESLQTKILQLQQTSSYDKSSRKAAEEREKSATARAEEAEEAHARALAELATLHSRTTTAEVQLRENNARLAEATAELSQYRSGSDNSRNQIEQLQQSLDQHKKTLEKANITIVAANEKANEAESLWIQARQDIVSLEKEAAGLRAELDIKMRDLDRTHARANEMERLYIKAQKEVDAVHAMMQEGMTELLNTSRSNNEGNNNSSEATKRIKMLEREIANLKSAHVNSQKASQETSSSLADAMVKISQMEGAAMKARSDAAMMQRKLVEASDENAKTKDKLREKEILLTERTRALEDAEVKVGMMRNVMTERGILDNGGNDNKGGILSSRLKQLELKYGELENEHNQVIRKAKDAEEKAKILEIELERASSAGSKSLTPDSSKDIEDDLKLAETKAKEVKKELNETKQKLHQVQNDYQTAAHYVNTTEKMLRKMKEELTKSKKEVVTLNEKLLSAQKRNEELEEKLAETEDNLSARKELNSSKLQEFTNRKLDEQKSEFIKEKEKLQERISVLKSELERAYEEKNMMDAEYGILRKEYEMLRKENESLQLIDQELRESLKESEKALRGTQNELDELYSNVSKEFNSIKSGPKGSNNWEGPRAMLERQIAEYRATNEKLAKENSDLEQKWRESENKITLLLDQMEHAVDSYREIEDDIRDSSPRNSNILSTITNELDMLKNQWDTSNQDTELIDDDYNEPRWLPNNNNDKNDNSRMISTLGNMDSESYNTGNNTGNMGNMFNNNSPRNFNNPTRGPVRIIDQIRGQLSLTPPPTPPASHQI